MNHVDLFAQRLREKRESRKSSRSVRWQNG